MIQSPPTPWKINDSQPPVLSARSNASMASAAVFIRKVGFWPSLGPPTLPPKSWRRTSWCSARTFACSSGFTSQRTAPGSANESSASSGSPAILRSIAPLSEISSANCAAFVTPPCAHVWSPRKIVSGCSFATLQRASFGFAGSPPNQLQQM